MWASGVNVEIKPHRQYCMGGGKCLGGFMGGVCVLAIDSDRCVVSSAVCPHTQHHQTHNAIAPSTCKPFPKSFTP